MPMAKPNHFIGFGIIEVMPFDFLLSTDRTRVFFNASGFDSIGKKGFAFVFQGITGFLLNRFAFSRFKNFVPIFPIKIAGIFSTFGCLASSMIVGSLIFFSGLADFVAMNMIVGKNEIASTLFAFVSALASIYQILLQILAAPEKFGYQILKSKTLPVLEGDFTYGHSSLKIPDTGPEGDFHYGHLKATIEEILSGWFVTPWFSDWFGAEEIFTFEHQRLMKSAPAEGASFEFENVKQIVPPVILNDDFKYKRF